MHLVIIFVFNAAAPGAGWGPSAPSWKAILYPVDWTSILMAMLFPVLFALTPKAKAFIGWLFYIPIALFGLVGTVVIIGHALGANGLEWQGARDVGNLAYCVISVVGGWASLQICLARNRERIQKFRAEQALERLRDEAEKKGLKPGTRE